MKDGLYYAAWDAAKGNDIGARFIFTRLPKPWYWVFTFWKYKWTNYGRFDRIEGNDPRFPDAQYELSPVWHPNQINL